MNLQLSQVGQQKIVANDIIIFRKLYKLVTSVKLNMGREPLSQPQYTC